MTFFIDKPSSALAVEIKRKLFHMLGFIYVLGLAMLSRPQFLIAVAVLWGVVSVLEVLRLRHSGAKLIFERFGRSLFRDRELSQFSGVWWMLLGVMASAALLPPFQLAITPILYLLLGDAAASLVGRGIKGAQWPGLNKSVNGSTACFLVCVVIGCFTLLPNYGWGLIIAGALVATILEAGLIRIDDNLLIPLGTALIFKIWT